MYHDHQGKFGLGWWQGQVTEGGVSPPEENPWLRATGVKVKTASERGGVKAEKE